ncbi:MAG TPA: hypothetical protein VMM93_06370 [Vicinamibacterales bacterium]|nr:hypothetical protein [Vicinamibacterales bacterium]
MRGDSIRDLYAKTVALVGLGLLAGIGALVDYWPIGVTPPEVMAVRLPGPEAAAVIEPDVVRVPVVLARVEPAAPPPAIALLAVNFETEAPTFFGETIGLSRLAEPAPAPLPTMPVATTVSTWAPDPLPFVSGPDFDPALVYQLAADDDAGFLSDAVDIMKTTGSTIARGGAITGASIVSALRAVSGAFKKLKPF